MNRYTGKRLSIHLYFVAVVPKVGLTRGPLTFQEKYLQYIQPSIGVARLDINGSGYAM